MDDIYNIEVRDSANSNISMSDFSGKTLLIVNVASKCVLTTQYKGLQKLYDDYKDRNFESAISFRLVGIDSGRQDHYKGKFIRIYLS